MAGTSPGAEELRPEHTIDKAARPEKEKQQRQQKRKQRGIGFPSAGEQKHLLIIRLNLAPPRAEGPAAVKAGLQRLCNLFARFDDGTKQIDVLDRDGNVQPQPLSKFHFSATIGFGIGFFDLLEIPAAKRPKKLRAMPDHEELGDVTPYSLGQTDMIIQLGSSSDFVNRWSLENVLQPLAPSEEDKAMPEPEDIVSAIAGWATITDVHAGFQRLDGRNLQGFNDGVSNPRRLSALFDELVWTTEADEGAALKDGTYMVFQKIVHDLDQWRVLGVDKQQKWVGRSKGTGLLLGTLPEKEDEDLAHDLQSPNVSTRERALAKWKPLFDAQTDPLTRFYDHVGGDADGEPLHHQIPNKCPAWSHVRKANPREEDGRIPRHLIFRRGYPFMENGMDHKTRTGLLFVGFQKDIAESFEFMKTKWFGNGGFPVPQIRPFTTLENDVRHQSGRFSAAELTALTADERKLLGLSDPDAFEKARKAADKEETKETGREGLAGPSEHGVIPTGEFLAIVPLGGGYYFCPPIPNQDLSQIGQQFFS
jgi:Dyp-type peroxidase family